MPFHLLQQHVFNPFALNDDEDTNVQLFDCDPDLQYFNDTTYINSINKCDYFIEDGFKKKCQTLQTDHNNLSIFHLNIRSIPKNLGDLNSYLSLLETEFTVLGLTETWLTESNVDCYSVEGYKHYYKYRAKKRGGGVSLFIKKEVSLTEREDLNINNSLMESIFVELEKDNFSVSSNIIVGLVYRPPNTDVREFTDLMSDILEKLSNENKLIYLMGDFNINLDVDSHLPSSDFIETFYTHGLFPLITKPTRVQNNSATLIDNIFHNGIDNRNFNGILYTDLSDHFPVFSISRKCKITSESQNLCFRNMSYHNIEKFINKLRGFDWSFVKDDTNGKSAFKSFYKAFHQLYDKSFPIKKRQENYLNRKPWLSSAMQNSIKLKNKLYVSFKKSPTLENLERYKDYKRLLNRLMKKAERQHYHDLMESNKYNTKKLWTILKDIINKKKSHSLPTKFKIGDTIITDKTTIANSFNDYFINIGNNLTRNICESNHDPLTYMSGSNPNSLFISEVQQHEVRKIILSLKEASAGWDGMHAKVIRRTFEFYIEPLTHVLNLSLSQGFFPTELKLAKVIPLHKSGDTKSINNYRPVSVLPVLSKILERLMYSRLINFINKHNILYKFQFGFREKHSTNMAIVTLIDKISNALDNGEYVIGVFLDLQKAFDTVNHKILLNKLHRYGIRGIAHNWFSDYLHERYQFVNYDNFTSTRKKITCGVPQGSILGPLLFLLYLNDIYTVSNLLVPIIFADDTNIFINGKNLAETVTVLNEELVKVSKWLNANKLALNVNKTSYMVFRTGRRPLPDHSTVKINETEIKCVEHTKFVGVSMDSKLTWEYHIRHCKAKVSRGIGILTKAKKVLNCTSLLTLYNSLIYPYFTYCIEVWGSASKTYIEPLFRMQKQIVRIIKSASYRAESSPLFKELKLLSLANIYRYCLLVFMFKFVKGLHPPICNDIFTRNVEANQRITRQRYNLKIPRCKTELLKRTIRYKGVSEWNNIEATINHFCSIHSFKRKLKYFLLSE
jgi:hypothetical protein